MGLGLAVGLGSSPAAAGIAPPSSLAAPPEPVSTDGGNALPSGFDASDFVEEVEDRLNAERVMRGLPALPIHGCTRAAADRHALDLADNGLCAHQGSDQSSAGGRMLDAGCQSPYGEIVACGYLSPETVVEGWMRSHSHRAIILCETCASFGAAYRSTEADYRFYWVVNYAWDPVSIPTAVPAEPPEMLPGDVDCDGERTGRDALYILQYDAGQRDAQAGCPEGRPGRLRLPACDVNQDERCNGIDALFILQCDAGIPNRLCPMLQTGRHLRSGLEVEPNPKGHADAP